MINKNEILYVKCFPGASITDLLDYGKPSLRKNPTVIIYHAGTNSLSTEDEPRKIANEIKAQTIDMKSDSNEIFINSIVIRKDKLNDEGRKVNDFLKIQCCLNKSGIHLNKTDTITLAKNFIEAIKN